MGDYVADGSLGYSGAALMFGGALAVIAALYFWTQVSRVVLFWAAFILTRPLGATVGDFLDKPVAKGGLEFSRPRLVPGHRRRMALYRARQVAEEWLRGIVKRSLARRVPERAPVPIAGCSETDHRGMADGLQHSASA